MSAAEKLRALPERIEELTAQISDGFPAVSSGAGDPMISGLGALSDLENLLDAALPAIIAVVEAAEVFWEPGPVDGMKATRISQTPSPPSHKP